MIQELADAANRFRNQRPAGQLQPNEREKVEMTFKYALIRNIMVFVLFVLLHTLAQVSHLLLAMCCVLDTCVLRSTCLCGVRCVCLACCVCVRSVLFSRVLRMQFGLVFLIHMFGCGATYSHGRMVVQRFVLDPWFRPTPPPRTNAVR